MIYALFDLSLPLPELIKVGRERGERDKVQIHICMSEPLAQLILYLSQSSLGADLSL